MISLDFEKIIDVIKYNANDPLLFNSSVFLIFFFFFLLAFTLFHNNDKIKIYFLTFFSLYFFYKTCGWYVIYILIAAIVDYNISTKIYKSRIKWNRLCLLYCSIFLNLGLLFYFKYTNFFIGIINDFTSNNISLIKLILPVGISFYTFENLSYTIDIYDRKFKPVKKFIDYLFFLSFFPKLMMGPIVRAADFVPQIYKKININDEKIGIGLYLITSGIIKKIVISDYINENFVKYIFSNPSSYTGIECLFAVYGYALVIYCDFSGYSDMAIGIAKWIGFDININFLSPYQSTTITEFWRRWHISLSSWLKDYLYIRWLGGNKKGNFKTNINLLATMLLGGFWHGASWNFIFWGGLHGIGLIIDKIRIKLFNKLNITNSLILIVLRFWGLLITFNFVCFCWIFFRCETFQNSWVMINKIFTQFHFEKFILLFNNYTNVFIIVFLGLALHSIPLNVENNFKQKIIKMPILLKIIYLFICIFIAIQFKQAQTIKPIYLQF